MPLAALLAGLWFFWAFLAQALTRNPRRDPAAGLTLALLRAYARWFQRVRITGAEHVPTPLHPGPLIVVCNHTAGVDPVLVQAAVRFEVRWMMARDMMPGALADLWAFTGVIPVNRAGADTTAARQALRYLADGDPPTIGARPGVIGIFPEGGIERPARTVLPFQPGVGLLIHKSKAPVLQVIIEGTAQTPTAWGSLVTRPPRPVSLTFLPIKDYRDSGLSAAAIAEDLRARLIAATGWPATDVRSAETQR